MSNDETIKAFDAHLTDYLDRKGVVLRWPNNLPEGEEKTFRNAFGVDGLTPEISAYWRAMYNCAALVRGETLGYRYCNCGKQFFVDTYPSGTWDCPECPEVTCEVCGEINQTALKKSCRCWQSLEGLPLADLKAIFADMDLSLEAPPVRDAEKDE